MSLTKRTLSMLLAALLFFTALLSLPTQASAFDWGPIAFTDTNIGSDKDISFGDVETIFNSMGVDIVNDSYQIDLSTLTGPVVINATAFRDCTGMTGILTIPPNVISIGGEAFANTGITGLDLSNATILSEIGAAAFENCASLTGTLYLPPTLTDIGANAFQGCRDLTGTITIPPAITLINGSTFQNTGITGLDLSNAAALTRIQSGAFFGCANLTGTLTIPASITYIGIHAFRDCAALDAVVFEGNPAPTILQNAFQDVGVITVYYPAGVNEYINYTLDDPYTGNTQVTFVPYSKVPQADSGDYDPTFTSQNLTDPSTGVRLSGNNIDRNARLRVTQGYLHAKDTCPACDEIRKQLAAGNVLALYDISLTGYHTGTYEIFIPFSGATGQSYTTLHCLKGTLEQRSAPYEGGGTTTTWARLSPFAVVKGAAVNVPDTVVVDPPKTGDATGHGMAGIGLLCCALLGLGVVKRRRNPE